MNGEKQISAPSLGERGQKEPGRRSEGILSKMVTECWFFVSIFSVSRSRTHHTHSLHAHFSGVHTLRVHFAHFHACTFTHGSRLQCACRHLSFVSPSPFSCFTRPCSCCSCKVTSRPLPATTLPTVTSTTSCRTFPTWKRRSSALRTRTSCLATWPSSFPTGHEPKEFDKITSVDNDTTLINDQNHSISDFSKTTNENTRQFGVHTVLESSVLHVSHRWFCSSERK